MLRTGLQAQTVMFLCACLLGAVLGVVYDLLRVLRRELRLRRTGTALLDILFCLTASAAFLLFVLRDTDGRLRGYLPLGLLVGGLLYLWTISRVVRQLLRGALRGLRRALSWSGRQILWMFSFPRGN